METSQPPESTASAYLYQYATNLLASGKKSTAEVEHLLQLKGLDADGARTVVQELAGTLAGAKKAQAKKDMLHGGLWCAGGLALTLADVGFVFWGAIVFGGYQFIKGVVNMK